MSWGTLGFSGGSAEPIAPAMDTRCRGGWWVPSYENLHTRKLAEPETPGNRLRSMEPLVSGAVPRVLV